jgi:hypothetical protein
MSNVVKETVECDCHSEAHTLQFCWFEDDKDVMYVTVHLTPFSLFQRIWYAIKYIFGKPSKFGCFEEYVWTREKVVDAQAALDRFMVIGENNG